MSQPFIGQITIFAGNFAPRGWAFCNGQIIPIAQNMALFSIIGTTCGGNGQSNFALPDLRGRLPLHFGRAIGSPSNYVMGQTAGAEQTTLTSANLPAHQHPLNVATAISNQATATATSVAQSPNNAWLATSDRRDGVYYSGSSSGATALNTGSIGVTGGGPPFSNLPPILALNFIIATEGMFPSRN